ncbi:importin-5-like protein [Tanacetum coccineum]
MPEVLRSTKLAIKNGQSQGRNEPYEPETKISASMLDAINEYVQICGPLLDVGDCLGTLLDTYTTLFFPLLDKLLPYLMPMTFAEKRIAIFIFVDVGEHCGDATFK